MDTEKDGKFTACGSCNICFTDDQTEAQGAATCLGSRLANSGSGI